MGGGGNQTQTTTNTLPPELAKWSNAYLNALGNLVMPGGQIAQSRLPSRAVAPMSPQQTQGLNMVSQETYGPGGAPQGQGGQGANIQQLMASIAGSPYWQAQLAQNPSLASAFSIPALGQIQGLYG